MFKNYILIVGSSIVLLLIACRKDNHTPLPDASVVFQQGSGGDTMQLDTVSIQSDSTISFDVMAKISGKATSNSDHWVEFAADSTQINAYRVKYGDALLLPSANYLLYRPMAKIGAGASVSDTGKVNLFNEVNLQPLTTYVLPLVIHTVDGKRDGAASKQVLYVVIKTGNRAFLDKTGWTMIAVSSFLVGAGPTGAFYYSPFLLLDYDETSKTSSWVTDLQQHMPQYFTMDCTRNETFSGVNYVLGDWVPTDPKLGGYPTSIQIETSLDGSTWTNNGIFPGGANNTIRTYTIPIGQTTARYLRFTVLAVQPYVDVETAGNGQVTTYYLDAVFMGGIRLAP